MLDKLLEVAYGPRSHTRHVGLGTARSPGLSCPLDRSPGLQHRHFDARGRSSLADDHTDYLTSASGAIDYHGQFAALPGWPSRWRARRHRGSALAGACDPALDAARCRPAERYDRAWMADAKRAAGTYVSPQPRRRAERAGLAGHRA